jgi:hypothetical protein
MRRIKALIACERSKVVRNAFNSYHGVDAICCDVLPPEDGELDDCYYMGDVRDLLKQEWDIMIAFPPCTFLANSGVKHLYLDGKKSHGINFERLAEMKQAAEFFNLLLNAPVPYKMIENPIQHGHARKLIRKYDQIIQPHMFGHMEQKATCIWVEGLPTLKPTNDVYDAMMKLPKNIRERVHYAPPSDDRWMERSRTLLGIADAIAEQYVDFLIKALPHS